jgi:hypothetical protein
MFLAKTEHSRFLPVLIPFPIMEPDTSEKAKMQLIDKARLADVIREKSVIRLFIALVSPHQI